MNDLIKRQDAINTLADMHCKSDGDGYVWIVRSDAWARIDALPSAQPERNKGHWIRHDEIKNVYGGIYIECSECGEKYVVQHIEDEKYCRNCGASMEWRGEEE